MSAQSMVREIEAGRLALHAVCALSVVAGFVLYGTGLLPAVLAIGGLIGLGSLTAAVVELIRSTRDRPAEEPFYPEVDALPQTSVAEFRRGAHRLYRTAQITTPSYIPALGIRGVIAFFGWIVMLALVEEIFKPGRLAAGLFWFLLVGAATALAFGSKVASNHRQHTRNAQVLALARRVEDKHRAGEIPLAPPDWDGPIPSPL
ncbi:hypothetical protein GCM10022261_18690 [Brevibacterium daeguense]|uniref:Sensor protein n=1 Tax=Brevibacterium daeguense TaxID=909936 RepID=A0ABP8EK62_9MICO|nr:hypothetical protein [Brevibacterium daeguense]